jgi:dTDP-4-dehydrorhamnose 3,5-epimerase
MEVENLGVTGPYLITPRVFKDERGYFFESFNQKEFNEKIYEVNFVQDNESRSSYGVLRGLHFQKPPYDQAKLVRVVKGAVYDVAVDLRTDSPTYGKYFGVLLTEDNHQQFFVPRGFAHGFVALGVDNIFQYKCDNFYNKESEGAIAWDDKDLNIDWANHIFSLGDIVLSNKDKLNKPLSETENPF